MLTVFKKPSQQGVPAHAHTGGTRGDPRPAEKGLVLLGDRSACRAQPQHGQGLPARGRRPGERRRAVEDHFERYQPYVAERLREDPHVWASALYDEVRSLCYEQSYVTFAREVRRRRLRPRCEACAGRRGHGPTIEIVHEPGEEILWGTPHRISYAAPGNMRRQARADSD